VALAVLEAVSARMAGVVRAFLCKAIIMATLRWHASDLAPTPSSSLWQWIRSTVWSLCNYPAFDNYTAKINSVS
jgi:hypothetical protein